MMQKVWCSQQKKETQVRKIGLLLLLIIGDKIVHNFMIDSGASSSMMPRCVAKFLGIKYEPMVRDVL